MKIRSFIIISLLLFLSSCGKKPEEETLEAIDLAQTYLSEDECQKAIDILEDVGRDQDNAVYLQTLASGYACRAGFSEVTFFSIDIPKLNTTLTGFLDSLATFSTSPQTVADSDSYTDLKTAINLVLEIETGVAPSQVARNTKFGARRAGDLGTQYIYMGLAQLGKFVNFYGNVNSAGAKGLGAANVDEQGSTASTCFVDYESGSSAATYIDTVANPGGLCSDTTIDIGHPDLSLVPASLTVTQRRMCEGLILFTNLIDTINNVELSSNTSLGNISAVKALTANFESAILAADPTLSTLLSMTSQSECETNVSTASNFLKLQYIYALLFETGL